jgi:hypothetical protein
MEGTVALFWLVPICFFGLGVAAAYYGDQTAAGGCLLAAVCLTAVGLAVRHVWRRRKARGTVEDQFLAWLGANHRAVQEGTAIFRDVRITPRTELVRFTTVISVGVLTYKTPSRFYLPGVESTGWVSAAYTAATFLLGWWGIPWGLIYTPAAIFRNLSGGERVTVSELLANVELGDREKADAMQSA